MLKLKDLINRQYVEKQCKAFEYELKGEKDARILVAKFEVGANENEWSMQIVLDRTRDADSQVYKFDYVMPRNNLPLELIAATGLKYFQLYLKEEIQTKSEYDFMLGDVLKGM
mgnify:CR=1 FL=1